MCVCVYLFIYSFIYLYVLRPPYTMPGPPSNHRQLMAALLIVALGGSGSALGHDVIGLGLGLGKGRCQESHFASLKAVATIQPRGSKGLEREVGYM